MSKNQSVIDNASVSDEGPSKFRSSSASIAWAISIGIVFGALIGSIVGLFFRPKRDITELSQEWLDEFKDVTERVTARVSSQIRDMVSTKTDRSERFEEYL